MPRRLRARGSQSLTGAVFLDLRIEQAVDAPVRGLLADEALHLVLEARCCSGGKG